jgi:hypothetical protein
MVELVVVGCCGWRLVGDDGGGGVGRGSGGGAADAALDTCSDGRRPHGRRRFLGVARRPAAPLAGLVAIVPCSARAGGVGEWRGTNNVCAGGALRIVLATRDGSLCRAPHKEARRALRLREPGRWRRVAPRTTRGLAEGLTLRHRSLNIRVPPNCCGAANPLWASTGRSRGHWGRLRT